VYGPTGIGALYGKPKHLELMPPYQTGGDMISYVSFAKTTWNELPYKFEAGTPNIADAIALGAAVDYLEALGMDNIRAREKEIVSYALKRLGELPEIKIYGPPNADERTGVVTFNYGEVHPHDLSQFLDRYNIAIRAGHHCAQPLMRRLECVATARASFYVYNTEAEVDALVEALQAAGRYFLPQAVEATTGS
jgi:cysteine desulfurase/selenocysteine lyase